MHAAEFGVAKTIDLIPNGSNIPVTRDNRLEYILRTAHFRLTKQIKRQSEAFFEGLSEMIDPKWLRCVRLSLHPNPLFDVERISDCIFTMQHVQSTRAASAAWRCRYTH